MQLCGAIIMSILVQTRECVVTVVGTADNPAPSCNDNGDTSQTQTIANPLAADTAAWTAWMLG